MLLNISVVEPILSIWFNGRVTALKIRVVMANVSNRVLINLEKTYQFWVRCHEHQNSKINVAKTTFIPTYAADVQSVTSTFGPMSGLAPLSTHTCFTDLESVVQGANVASL